MYYKIIFTILIIFFAIILTSTEKFSNQLYLAEPTKCFSCEKNIKNEKKYLGGRTKCFSCEKYIAKSLGNKFGSLGQPSKCFSCENQILNNIITN